jgi:hypothetical protein
VLGVGHGQLPDVGLAHGAYVAESRADPRVPARRLALCAFQSRRIGGLHFTCCTGGKTRNLTVGTEVAKRVPVDADKSGST